MTTNSKVKQYFIECFQKDVLIRKGIIAAIACALVLILSLSFYFWLKPLAPNSPKQFIIPFGSNGFWYIKLIWNTGIGFSALDGNLAAIFSIQTIVFLLLLALYLLICKDNISSAFMACAIFGGLFNLLQRAATPNLGVLDYFQFGFWENFATFNWPDMFVVVGVFGFVISYIVYTVRKEDDEFEEKQAQEEESKESQSQNPVVAA